MGIVFNNAIRNGGQMPKIQATTDINTIVGQNNSLALDTSVNTLYYWDPITLSWITVVGSGFPGDLQSVLNIGYQASSPIEITSYNITVNEASLVSQDVNLDASSVVNGEGYELLKYDGTLSYAKLLTNGFGVGLLRLRGLAGGKTTINPASLASDIYVELPNTTGTMYNLVFAAVTLTNGVGTYTVSGGSNNVVMGITVSNINTSSTIGVAYKWSAFGSLITITSLKTNGGTETSDVSTLNVAIAK